MYGKYCWLKLRYYLIIILFGTRSVLLRHLKVHHLRHQTTPKMLKGFSQGVHEMHLITMTVRRPRGQAVSWVGWRDASKVFKKFFVAPVSPYPTVYPWVSKDVPTYDVIRSDATFYWGPNHTTLFSTTLRDPSEVDWPARQKFWGLGVRNNLVTSVYDPFGQHCLFSQTRINEGSCEEIE